MTLFLIIVFLILLIISYEADSPGIALLFTIITAIVAGLRYYTEIINYLREDWLQAIVFALLYIVIGIIVGMAKWFLFCYDEAESLEKKINEIKQTNAYQIDADTAIKQFTKYYRRPVALEHSEKIVMWSTFWVWTIISFLIKDFAIRVFDAAFKFFRSWYDKISHMAFGKLNKYLD